MAIILYHSDFKREDSFDNFKDLYLRSKMKYLASDLLKVGISAKDISEAVKRAIRSCRNSGLEVKSHFAMVYTQLDDALISDCKLSKIGYALVLLNANVNEPIVAKWQVQLVTDFLEK